MYSFNEVEPDLVKYVFNIGYFENIESSDRKLAISLILNKNKFRAKFINQISCSILYNRSSFEKILICRHTLCFQNSQSTSYVSENLF